MLMCYGRTVSYV